MRMTDTLAEFRDGWLPYATDAGVTRLVELLESGSPLLIHGAFSRACAMGCLATHLAWHHPLTRTLNDEAGVVWLTRVAGLNPATSLVVIAWDRAGLADWGLRAGLLEACQQELITRREAEGDHQLSKAHNAKIGNVDESRPTACDVR